MSFRLVIHGREIYSLEKGGHNGIPKVNRQIAEELPKYLSDFRITTFSRPDASLMGHSNNTVRPSLQRSLRNNQFGGALEILLTRSQISYSLSTEVPRFGAAQKIGLIHDVIPLTHPELCKNGSTHKDEALFQNIAQHSDLIHCISKHTQSQVIERLGVPEERTFVAYNGTAFSSQDSESSFNQEKPYLLSVSRIDPRKNFARLIEAFSIFCETNSELELVIVGKDGWGTSDVYEAFEKSPFKSRIHLKGFVSEAELDGLYRGAFFYICPSITEGFGLPIIEAISRGVPVISSNGGALPEILPSNSLLFDPYNLDAIIHALQSISDRSETWKSQHSFVQKFSIENQMQSIADAVRQLCN
jgi:glycosyltransferase involved in cell wall biosynthesis